MSALACWYSVTASAQLEPIANPVSVAQALKTKQDHGLRKRCIKQGKASHAMRSHVHLVSVQK